MKRIFVCVIKPERGCEGNTLGRQQFVSSIFFKQMAVAHLIFTLDGGFQLFWAAFVLPMTVVPLNVAFGLEKLIFGHFKKIIIYKCNPSESS